MGIEDVSVQGAEDIGDALLGNFLQGVSTGTRNAAEKGGHSIHQNGEKRRAFEAERQDPKMGAAQHKSKEEKRKKKADRRKPKSSKLSNSEIKVVANTDVAVAGDGGQFFTSWNAPNGGSNYPGLTNSVFELAPSGRAFSNAEGAVDSTLAADSVARKRKADEREEKASRRGKRNHRRSHETTTEVDTKQVSQADGTKGNAQSVAVPLHVEAAAITDDTADDILGSFLKKVLGGCKSSEPTKETGATSPPVAVPASLPEVGDLLGSNGHETGDDGLDLELRLDPTLPVAHESGAESILAREEEEPKDVARSLTSVPEQPPLAQQALKAASMPSGVGTDALEAKDSSDSDDSSSSSSTAELHRRMQVLAAVQARSCASASSSSSSSSSSSGSYGNSGFFACEWQSAVSSTPGDTASAWPGRVARRACAKLSVRANLRCSCHFALLRCCPDRGEQVVGDEYCGSDD
jgi:hypothetical protein